jgi:hypothetical protein
VSAAITEIVTVALDLLPAPTTDGGVRLLKATRRFIASPLLAEAVAADWPIDDLFGVHEYRPLDRRDLAGLLPTVALAPKRGRKLVEIDATGATFRDLDGRTVRFRRPSLEAPPHDLGSVVDWWTCPALVNLEGDA